MLSSYVKFILITAILAGLTMLAFALRSEQEAPVDAIYSPHPRSPIRKSAPEFYSCVYNDSYRAGRHLVLNNQWNRRLMGPNDSYQQCIQVNNPENPLNVEWTWSWPKLQGEVKAFPEIIYGWAPWLDSSTTAYLPAQLSVIVKTVRFQVDFDTYVSAPGATYNTMFDLFLTSSAIPTPETRTHEVMIWVNDQNPWVSTKSTSYVGRLTFGRVKYDFWRRPGKQTIFIFRRVQPTSQDSIVINQFLDYLLTEGYLSGDEYLADIEFGNEIISGSGRTQIRSYFVTPLSLDP